MAIPATIVAASVASAPRFRIRGKTRDHGISPAITATLAASIVASVPLAPRFRIRGKTLAHGLTVDHEKVPGLRRLYGKTSPLALLRQECVVDLDESGP